MGSGLQWTVYCTVSVRSELREKLIAAFDGKPPWSTKLYFRTVREILHHDVVGFGIFLNKFGDKYPLE